MLKFGWNMLWKIHYGCPAHQSHPICSNRNRTNTFDNHPYSHRKVHKKTFNLLKFDIYCVYLVPINLHLFNGIRPRLLHLIHTKFPCWSHMWMASFSLLRAFITDCGSFGFDSRKSRWCAVSGIMMTIILSFGERSKPPPDHGSIKPLLNTIFDAYLKFGGKKKQTNSNSIVWKWQNWREHVNIS